MSRENNLFCPNSTAGSAEPAFGSHLAYHTDPQRNQNDTVTQECLQKNRSTTPQIVDLSSLKSTKTPMIVTLIQHIIFPIFKFVQDLLVAQPDNACAASAVDYYDPLWSPSTIPCFQDIFWVHSRRSHGPLGRTSRYLQQSPNDGACNNEFVIHYEGTTDAAQPVLPTSS